MKGGQKRAKFTEEQIIEVLREHEARAKTADLAAQARRLGGDAIIGSQIWWHGCYRGQATEAARGQECQAEENFGGADAGCSRTPRASGKKW